MRLVNTNPFTIATYRPLNLNQRYQRDEQMAIYAGASLRDQNGPIRRLRPGELFPDVRN